MKHKDYYDAEQDLLIETDSLMEDKDDDYEDYGEYEDHSMEFYFSNPDPYFKMTRPDKPQLRPGVRFGEDGHLHAKNISAFWIPELTLTEEIGGTVYTVTGSYEGTTDFLKKLERITAKKFTDSTEESQ